MRSKAISDGISGSVASQIFACPSFLPRAGTSATIDSSMKVILVDVIGGNSARRQKCVVNQDQAIFQRFGVATPVLLASVVISDSALNILLAKRTSKVPAQQALGLLVYLGVLRAKIAM